MIRRYPYGEQISIMRDNVYCTCFTSADILSEI